MKIKEYLDSLGIDYDEEGENVTYNNVEIQCPFSGCSDELKHLGINLDNGLFSCWVCGTTGNIGKLIKELENCSWYEANERADSLKKFSVGGDIEDILLEKEEETETTTENISLPKEARYTIGGGYSLLWKYLDKRKITKEMEELYNLHYCRSGYYGHHLIIPVEDKGFVARDMTGKANLKYRYPKGFHVKDHLYGQHEGDVLYLVEGCFDAMRVDGICCFGKSTSGKQRNKLMDMYKKKRFRSLVIAFDDDAYNEAIIIGEEFRILIEKVKVLRLPKGEDPADLGKIEIKKIENNTPFL